MLSAPVAGLSFEQRKELLRLEIERVGYRDEMDGDGGA